MGRTGRIPLEPSAGGTSIISTDQAGLALREARGERALGSSFLGLDSVCYLDQFKMVVRGFFGKG